MGGETRRHGRIKSSDRRDAWAIITQPIIGLGGHGPKYYLSVSFPGQRPQMNYIPADIHEQTSASLADIQRVREILEEICEINRELLRRRETL